jgi:hypothetical protein
MGGFLGHLSRHESVTVRRLGCRDQLAHAETSAEASGRASMTSLPSLNRWPWMGRVSWLGALMLRQLRPSRPISLKVGDDRRGPARGDASLVDLLDRAPEQVDVVKRAVVAVMRALVPATNPVLVNKRPEPFPVTAVIELCSEMAQAIVVAGPTAVPGVSRDASVQRNRVEPELLGSVAVEQEFTE